MSGYDFEADLEAVATAVAPLDREETFLLDKLASMRAARLTAVRLAARWKPGDRVLCSGWSPAERVIVDVRPTEDGFVYLACRAPYRGRPISPLYPSQILGPAPVKENP